MRYWLMRATIKITEIKSSYVGRLWPYYKIIPDERLRAGDIVYLTGPSEELYSWGHVSNIERYHDKDRAEDRLKVSVSRPVIRQNLVPAGNIRELPSLAKLLAIADTNLIELTADDVTAFNKLIRSHGAKAPDDPPEESISIGGKPIVENHQIQQTDQEPLSSFTNVEEFKPPRVFISYSWESAKHQNWVRYLGERLCTGGVKARLDQWFVEAGHSVTQFMEEEVRQADFVLVVCTPIYAQKSNNRAGGVGYEQQIVSGYLVSGPLRSKFVPIIRAGAHEPGPDCAIPTHFMGIAWIDFRDEAAFEKSLEELLRVIHSKPEFAPPPIGPTPSFGTTFNTALGPHQDNDNDSGRDRHLVFTVGQSLYTRDRKAIIIPMKISNPSAQPNTIAEVSITLEGKSYMRCSPPPDLITDGGWLDNQRVRIEPWDSISGSWFFGAGIMGQPIELESLTPIKFRVVPVRGPALETILQVIPLAELRGIDGKELEKSIMNYTRRQNTDTWWEVKIHRLIDEGEELKEFNSFQSFQDIQNYQTRINDWLERAKGEVKSIYEDLSLAEKYCPPVEEDLENLSWTQAIKFFREAISERLGGFRELIDQA